MSLETIIQVDMSPETFYTPPPSPLYSTPPPPKYNSEKVPSSLLSIVPIVRLANELDPEYPRIAWLCINLAMREARAAQPNCTETGCRRYLDQLIGYVYAESARTAVLRQEETDLAEIQKFYESQLMNCLSLQNSENEEERLFLPTEYEKTCIIYQVMRQVTHCPSFSASNDEVMEMHNKVVARNFFVPFNIIPPSPPSPPSQMMLQSEELQIVMEALRSTHGLPWATGSTRGCADDILDWLQATFKFQVDSVKNQREHVSLLLANVSARQDPKLAPKTKVDKALTEVMDKLFENYEKWCSHLSRKSSIRSHSPTVRKYAQQYKLLCIGLYLLIWGEAANIRFLPECLCYIFHQMAHEMFAILDGNVSPLNGEDVRPAYGNTEDAFLKQVVTPIYLVVSQHAIQKGGGNSDHSASRNYDDFNEYFWSPGCFKLGWPMRLHSDFFCVPANKNRSTPRKIWIKTNFAEIRSFWHIFRSFSRMWIFFITCLHAMILIGWEEPQNPISILRREFLEKLLSIFITLPILNLSQAVVDILLSWKARQSMSFHIQLRYGMKFLSAIAWVIVLSITYARISEGLFRFGLAVVIYMLPHVVAGFLFILPLLGGYLEKSDNKIIFVLMWWSQCQLYVGRGIQGTFLSRLKYTMFWVFLLTVKMTFSYYFEVKPFVGPTKKIMETYISKYSWPEFSFLAEKNIGCVIVLWAPSLLVYFMDTQIWYCIFSTLIGGIYGAFLHLVEIQTLGMLRSRFRSLPSAFNKVLIPVENTGATTKELKTGFSGKVEENPSITKVEGANFAQLWNEVINSFREEDLISNREMELMIMPNRFHLNLNFIQWPPFLLAGKIPLAMNLVEVCSGQELKEKMEGDALLYFAVAECEASLRHIITSIVQGDSARQAFENVFDEVNQCAGAGNLINLERSDVHCVYNLVIKVVDILLRNKEEDLEQLKTVLQDILEAVLECFYQFNGFNNKFFRIDQTIGGVNSISFDGHNVRLGTTTPDLGGMLFASPGAIKFPVEQGAEVWKENLTRLHLLLTMKESAKDIPINVEARRRISFFTNSLFMDMPTAPKVENMRSFSVLTPYYSEDVLYTVRELELQNEDGVSILFYLQNIFPDEWTNFLERIGCNNVEIKKTNEHEEEVRCWASYRGQTLFRTVRGIMYYRKALEVQAFLNLLKYDDLLEGYKGANYHTRKRCQAVVDTKFTYVLSCQQFGTHKRSGDARAQDILKLMSMYPSLRVAYIDEVEEPIENAAIANKNAAIANKNAAIANKKVYYSVLVKASVKKSSKSKDPQPVQNLDQIVYRIRLPGPAILGEGKPENQNHAIVFTRGEALQTIDMNQDNYLEEALKIRNLLEEFNESHNGRRTILGLREHIFTGSVSSLAWFMSNQEMTFVTIGQRVLANPLKVRFHYGHPDVFDRLFHLTRGGISKASKVINLSEDIFAGFNSTLREGNVTHHEYIQVGKGREVGFNQISLFEAKIANGNGEQTISRDVYRLGHHFDFFRMLSLYFTTVGFYVSSLVTVLTIYLFLYGRLYLVFSGLENIFSTEPDFRANKPLRVLLTSEAFVQFGFFFVVPMLMEICLERGFRTALSSLLSMHVQLAPVFFTFSLGTKIHYYGRTLLHGGAEYRGTGRGFVVAHASFTENYMLYSRSHFVKGIEIMILLVVCQMFGNTYQNTLAHILFTMSMWFVVGACLFAPFLFNPSGFDWHKMVDDWTIWKRWINNHGGSGVSPGKSWESWWENQHEYLRHSGIWGCFIETVLSLRFLIYQYGLIYHLKLAKDSQSLWVYLAFWIVVVAAIAVFITLKNTKRINRIIKGSLFLIFNLLLVILMAISMITLQDILACFLAFACTGWLGLLIAQVFKPFLQQLGWWPFIREVARFFEGLIGLIVFIPLGILAWFPFISETHTRILFNQAFSRQLNISLLLGGKKDH